MMNNGPTVLLGVTGSVAAFRAIDLASRLTQKGYCVETVLTRGALRFVRPLSFEAVTHRCAYTDESPGILEGRALHVALAERAALALVAPASANLIGRYACGLAPDLLTSCLLATAAPVLLAPAMNTQMWIHPAVRDNVALLQKRGVRLIGPDSGLLSCGAEGPGRFWPVERLSEEIEALLPPTASLRAVSTRRGERPVAFEGRAFSLPRRRGEDKEVREMTEKKKPAKKPAVKKAEKNGKKASTTKKK